jgi:hypothetical protein
MVPLLFNNILNYLRGRPYVDPNIDKKNHYRMKSGTFISSEEDQTHSMYAMYNILLSIE